MSEEWDGRERRNRPHEYEFRNIIREEIEPLRETQRRLESKISEWELAAKWFRLFIIGTVTFIGLVAGAYEWLKDHLK
jgi:hypothetical protein